MTLSRPELLDSRPTWGTGLPSFTAIHLEPLPDELMARLLTGLAPDLPATVVNRVIGHAGGVPLYGVEVIRMLLDRSALDAAPGQQADAMRDAAAQLQIPDTLRSLVGARLGALPPPERALVHSASILGRRFHPEALEAIAGLRPTESRRRISALVRREILAVDDDLRSPGRGQLSFVQDIVREVAYRTVSRRERRALHLAAADHLAGRHDDELVEAQAEHLFEALRHAPEGEASVPVALRAIEALRAAAARARSLHVPLRALTHLQRALDLATDDDVIAELWEEAAAAARAAAQFEPAEEYLRRLIGYARATGQRRRAARAQAQLASLLLATERHGSAIGDLEAALKGMADLDSDEAGVALVGQLARARVLVGDNRQAVDWAQRALAAARALELDAVALDALTTLGTAEMRLGLHDAGLADLRLAIAEADRLGIIGAELRARNNLAWLVVLDDPHVTLQAAQAGLDLATSMGVADMALQLAEVVCAVAIDTGHWERALAIIDESHERPQAPAHRIQFAASEATIRALRGETAADRALAAIEPLDPNTDPQIRAAPDQARAWLAFLDGRPDETLRLADAAAAPSLGAEQQAAVVLAARAALWLGDVATAAARIEQLAALQLAGRAASASAQTLSAGLAALRGDATAGRMYETAIAAWRSLDLPLHLALCLAESDLLPGVAGGGSMPAGERSDEAEEILDRLGAKGVSGAIARRRRGPLPGTPAPSRPGRQ